MGTRRIHYHLPRDYNTLSVEGKKRARIECVRDQGTPEKAVCAWDFFCRYYLLRDKHDERLAPGFFYQDPRDDPPPIHFDMIEWAFKYRLNLVAIPRGFAKSTVIAETLPLFLSYTRPGFKTLLMFATETIASERMDRLMFQVANNPFLREDFGDRKPKRGDAIWNRAQMHFAGGDGEKGSEIRASSVGGQVLGWRGHLVICDDVERNPQDTSHGVRDQGRVYDELENLVFGTLRPMLNKGKCTFYLIGTMLDVSSFISRVYNSRDPRFVKTWNRVRRQSIEFDGNVKRYLWFDRFNEKELERLRLEMGKKEFDSQYQNIPGSKHDAVLKIDPHYHIYWTDDGKHPSLDPDPLSSQTKIKHNLMARANDGTIQPEIVTLRADKLFGDSFRLLTLDYAPGRKKNSDWSCILVSAFDKFNTLWALDMWQGKPGDEELLSTMWQYALRWRVHMVGIEAVPMQLQLIERAKGDLMELAKSAGHLPRIVEVKYPMRMPKEHRIAALEWRFVQHKIKLPGDLRLQGWWPQLWKQIEMFTLDLRNLEFDDAVDTLAMTQYCRAGRGRENIEQAKPLPIDRIRAGELYDKVTGLPWIGSVDLTQIDSATVEAMRQKQMEDQENEEANWHEC